MIMGLAIGYRHKATGELCWRFRVHKSDLTNLCRDNVMLWTEKNQNKDLPDWLFVEFLTDGERASREDSRRGNDRRGGRNSRINAVFHKMSTAGPSGNYAYCMPYLCVGNEMTLRPIPNYPTKHYRDLITNVKDGVHSVAFPRFDGDPMANAIGEATDKAARTDEPKPKKTVISVSGRTSVVHERPSLPAGNGTSTSSMLSIDEQAKLHLDRLNKVLNLDPTLLPYVGEDRKIYIEITKRKL